MWLPRGSALTLVSIATGLIAAIAVGIGWLPMIRESERRALDDQARVLELVAALALDRLADELIEGSAPLLRPDERQLPLSAEQVELVRAHAEATIVRIADLASLERLVLVDTRGRLLASEPPRLRALYGDLVVDPALQACDLERVVQERRRIRALFDEAGNERRQAICMPLRSAAGSVLGVLAVVGDSDPVAVARGQGSRDLVLLLVAATVAGLVTVGGIRSLLAPLTAVSGAASRIAAGERGVRVESRGPRELTQLAQAMNALAGAVESREDEIDGRMQVVQQLSSMVAHEVRNPLQSLSLLTSLARTEPDPEARDAQLQLIEEEIKGLEGVVQRFLAHSGPLRIIRTPTDLVRVLDRASAIARPRASQAGVRMQVLAPARLEAVADGSLVRRALENLLLNAIEFAGRERRGGQVQVVLSVKDGVAHFLVDDNGPGVDPSDRERIFEPYISGKPGGTGLGLALVRQVIQAHGGYIHCESSPLGGARFVAGIPLGPAPEGHA